MQSFLRILITIFLAAVSEAFSSGSRGLRAARGTGSLVMMPTLLVQTSKAISDIERTNLLRDASKAVASGLGKPESYVMVSFKKVDGMMFGGSEEPCAFCHLASIGRIGPDTNPKLSKSISEVLNKYLNVPANRVYIQFYDSEGSNFGFDGSTF